MLAAVGLIMLLTYLATRRNSVVPGRIQSLVEMSYEFIASTVRSSAGEEGMRFFPFVFTLFMFVLVLNLFGMIPYSFTVDRKSTRLNSSHANISYAVFCLKK